MKSFRFCFPSSICSVLLALSVATFSQAADTSTLYQEGLTAYQEKNWVVAVEKFTQVYSQTRNPRALYFLQNAKLRLSQGEPADTLEKKLSRVVIPNIQFEETDLPTALEFLRTKTVELSKGNVQPNILYKRNLNNPVIPKVTLQLSNIPVTEVIRYIGQVTNTTFKYETYAVVGVPAGLPVPENALPKKTP